MTCDSTQDYVTVLYQFTFEAFPPQWPMHGLIKQLITNCNMHLNMVNDLAEATKALDRKKNDMEAVAQPPVAGPAPAAFDAPIAPDEPAQPDDVAAGPEEIVLDGTRIDSSSSLTVLKAACSSLGVSTHGSRATVFQAFGAALTTARASGSALSETQLVQRPTATSQPAWNSK